jgi:hypothetical protein
MDGKPLLMSGQARKLDVIAYLAERDEAEIIVDPTKMQCLRVTKLPPKKPSDHALSRQATQAGLLPYRVYRATPGQIAKMAKESGRTLHEVLANLDKRIGRLQLLGFKDKVAELRRVRRAALREFSRLPSR